MARNNDFSYSIEEFISPIKESKSNWTKSIARIKWGDNPTTVDIRNMNIQDERMGKGISLSDEEANLLAELLVENDFGRIEELEKALTRRKQLYTPLDADEVNNCFGEKKMLEITRG